MEEIEADTIRLQEEFDLRGPDCATTLRPQVDRLMTRVARKGLPMPANLRRIDTVLRLEAEDDFFENMPV
ncbi:MAG: hypothetical protein AAF636_09815 [Pseudomonadota bacterium]